MTPLSIINLQISNFMRIEAAEISPNGSPIIHITGKNAAGKSSVINAIWAALHWRAAAGSIPEPIRRGHEAANVRIDLGDLIITRTWKGEKTSLTVTTREGAKYQSPQSVLDKLVSEIGFDPLEFCRMQPRDQRTTLMNLLKIDFSQLEQERAGLLQQKNLIDNQVTGLYQQLRDIPDVSEDIPDQEVSAGDIIQEIQNVQTFNQRLKVVESEYGEITLHCLRVKEEVNRLRVQLEKMEEQFDELIHLRENHDWNKIMDESPKDLSALQERLTNIEQINQQVRLKQQKTSILTRMHQAEQQISHIAESIKDIDQDKKDALASAKFPVAGLSFDESGILLNGVPFGQASTAEQIRVSLAMGIALNPDLRVLLIRDGNALDSSSLMIVEEMAREANMQIFMERVDESGKIGIVIEDGTVRDAIPPGQQVLA